MLVKKAYSHFHGFYKMSIRHWTLFLLVSLYSSNICLAQNIEIYSTSEVTTWSEATKQCDIYGIDNNSSEVPRNFNITLNNITGEYWIGGHSTYSKWMLLQGCYFGHLRNGGQRFLINESDDPIKMCMDKCSSAFAIDHDTCYCQSSISLTQSGCLAATSCGTGTNSFCGENRVFYHLSTRFTCMCLYHETRRSVLESIGNCLTYYPLIRRYKTEECSKPFPSVCRPGDSTRAHLFYPELDWIQAGWNCYRNNHQFDSTVTTNTSLPRYWVSIFRRSYYRWGTPAGRQRVNCLSVSVNNESVVTTNERICQTRLPALCQIFVEQTTPDYTTHREDWESTEHGTRNWTTILPTTGNYSDEDVTTATHSTSTDHKVSTNEIIRSSENIVTKYQNSHKEAPLTNTMMLIAIMSASFFVIFILCIALVVKRRQVVKKARGSSKKDKELVRLSDHNMADSVYTQIDNIRNECMYNEVSEKPDGSFAFGEPAPIMENAYDILETRNCKRNAEPNPLYDHITDFKKDDGTYGSLKKHRKSSINVKTFVDYDTLKSVREMLTGEKTYQELNEKEEEKKESVVLRDYDTLDNIENAINASNDIEVKDKPQTPSLNALPQQNSVYSHLMALKNNETDIPEHKDLNGDIEK